MVYSHIAIPEKKFHNILLNPSTRVILQYTSHWANVLKGNKKTHRTVTAHQFKQSDIAKLSRQCFDKTTGTMILCFMA